MIQKSVLCVVPAGMHPLSLIELGDAWKVHAVHDLESAEDALRNQRFLVGLLVLPQLREQLYVEVDRFLGRYTGLEWVGVFDAASLTLPAGRDLVLDHLFDHHTLPVDLKHLALTLGHAHGHAALRSTIDREHIADADSSIVGDSEALRYLRQQIARVAKVDAPVLITGESGSGKELAAQAVHHASGRATGPFVPVNCGAIPATLIQSELFGHARGAFTGAMRDRRGLVEAASGGTIFLDEIGDLPLELQGNLLRFLQENTISRVGSTQSVVVNARIVAATNVNLEAAVARGAFRQDLYYRLNVLPLHIPPLRERRTDIEPLARHVFARFIKDKGSHVKGFSRRAVEVMNAYAWPGNVRELINRVRRAMALAEGRLIGPADLGLEESARFGIDVLEKARGTAERGVVFASLQEAGRNVSEAARRLGVSRMTIYRLMAKHNIEL